MKLVSISRVEGLGAVINALAVPLAVLLAFGFEYAAFAVTDQWRNPPDWFVIALNTVPSGWLERSSTLLPRRAFSVGHQDAKTARWLPRNGVPLLLAGGLAALIIIDWSYRTSDGGAFSDFPLYTRGESVRYRDWGQAAT